MTTMHLPTTPLTLTLAERRRRMVEYLSSLVDTPHDVLRQRVEEAARRACMEATASTALRPVYYRLFLRDAHLAVGLSPLPDAAPLSTR